MLDPVTRRAEPAPPWAGASRGPASLSLPGDFPLIEAERAAGRIYLDSAATSQKPARVIEAVAAFDRAGYATVHRSMHALGWGASEAFEGARRALAGFVGARRPEEIVFTRGATDSLNLFAWSWGLARLQPGDEIVLSSMEHHSNLVPWQLVARRCGARLREWIPRSDGTLDLADLDELLGPRTRLVGLTHVSNVLGTVNDIAAVAERVHAQGALLVVDGAQALGHLPVDVARLGADVYAGSGHKMFGPSGTGFLWGRYELLEELPPHWGGGDMIESVRFEESRYAPPPARFEAGTPNISGVVGWGEAVAHLRGLGMDRVRRHDLELQRYALRRLAEVPGLDVYGPQDPELRSGLVSFNLRGLHSHDLAQALDAFGLALRAGHLCAQPLLARLGVASCVRASFAHYNEASDVDRLVAALLETRAFFALGAEPEEPS